MNVWVEAARPRTLVASVVPVLVGTAASGRFSLPRFLGTLIVAIAMQIGVNFANDLFDAKKGVDTDERLGPRRLTASGLITPVGMAKGMVLAFLVANIFGIWLAVVAGWELAVIGGVSVLAALGYSAGPSYASRGLGEVFVFVFFGLVATGGAAYVQAERVVPLALVAAIPVGLLAVAILVVNNLRDIGTDARSGKRTLAVRIGDARTRTLYKATIGGSYLSLGAAAAAGAGLPALLPMLSLPLAIQPLKIASTAAGRELIAALAGTAKLQLVFGILLAVGVRL